MRMAFLEQIRTPQTHLRRNSLSGFLLMPLHYPRTRYWDGGMRASGVAPARGEVASAAAATRSMSTTTRHIDGRRLGTCRTA